MIDVACHESSVRFPTNQKFLWESVEFLYRVMKYMCKKAGIKKIRIQYKNGVTCVTTPIVTKRRRTQKEKRILVQRLIKLVKKRDKGLDQPDLQYEFQDKKTYEKQRLIIKKRAGTRKLIL